MPVRFATLLSTGNPPVALRESDLENTDMSVIVLGQLVAEQTGPEI